MTDIELRQRLPTLPDKSLDRWSSIPSTDPISRLTISAIAVELSANKFRQ
jgi:hypothetical protein